MKKTLALACILKNEVNNLPRLLESVRGCFDEIHLTDTGSTDGSIELIQKWIDEGEGFGAQLFLHHFKWVDDFAAARNASFAPIKTDYIMWMDLDDVLSDKEKFLNWRESAMHLADFWLNTYHYSISSEGKPMCSFARERVIKNGIGLKWEYFVHEGIMPSVPGLPISYAQNWSVNHLRSEADLLADRSRNLLLFEKHPDRDARMSYYYGKELFENQKPLEAFGELVKAAAMPALQMHDRIMALQYACLAAMQLNQFDKAIQLAFQGLQLAPQRAEFLVVIADSHLKSNRVADAVPYYSAAAHCQFNGSSQIQGAIFSHEASYREYPLNQLARIYANMGDFNSAEMWANKALSNGENKESRGILTEVENMKRKLRPLKCRTTRDEIVITCPGMGLYEWDEKIYKERGIGGSETAAVEMAHWLSKLTNKKVLVFGSKNTPSIFGKVEYRLASEIVDYFRENSPALHVAWRHAIQFSQDPYYIWCHDLMVPGIERLPENASVLALSQFHKKFLMGLYGVDEKKIIVTSNGIDPKRFGLKLPKEEGKVVWSSSPDRGLERAIAVMDEVVKSHPEVRLHIYYGFDNMVKMGQQAKVDEFKAMIDSRPYITLHGNLQQKALTQELATACVWLYPTNFLETYCITAIEMLCSGVYPVVREWGALSDTLLAAKNSGMATVIDADCVKPEEVSLYAEAVTQALDNKLWEKVEVDPNVYAWEGVAKSWIEIFGLGDKCLKLSNS